MIFRRPDAFIIKHIKIIHAIILLGIGYLLYKTNEISVIYDRVAKAKSIIGQTYASDTYGALMYIVLVLCLIAVITIMVLLIKRKKRFVFYLATILLLGFMFVFYILSYVNIREMQQTNVAAPKYLAYGDVSRMLFYTHSVFTFAWLFKATGFNIKTFSFDGISYDLELDDGDDEEIEFNLEIDGNELKTKRRRKIRNLKYLYFENIWKINIIGCLILAILFVVVQMIIKANQPVYYELGNELKTRNYNIVVTDAYVTCYDYLGKRIDGNNSFVVLKFKIKKNNEQEYTFDDAYISVIVNGKNYYANPKYYEYFTDLGIAYKDQKLSQEYEDYYLAYNVPYEFSNEEILIKIASNFDYTVNRYTYYEIKTGYNRLNNAEVTKDFKLNDEMNVEAYGVKTKVIVSDFAVKDKFKITSNAEINKKIYSLNEYITPTAEDNEDKAIMRINYEETFVDNNKVNFATILMKYAIIEYEIDNNKKEGYFYSFISPKLSKEPNTYYVQVSKDVLKGTNRNIRIKIRNQVFNYKLD